MSDAPASIGTVERVIRLMQAIAEARPASLRELSGLPGIGARKLELYGADVLAELTE